MEKEKDLYQEEVNNSSDGKTKESAPQAELASETSPVTEQQADNSQTETAATSSESSQGEASQPSGEDQKPRNGQTVSSVEVEAQQPSIEELRDRFLRLAADFSNYKRRNESERAEFADYVRREFASALLPILDDFGLMMEYDSEHPERLAEGAKLIRQKLMELLSKQGLEKIEALNQPFDYERHDALLMQPVNDKTLDHVVLSVMQDGYLFKGKVLRPSKVIVGQFTEGETKTSASPDSGGAGESSKESN